MSRMALVSLAIAGGMAVCELLRHKPRVIHNSPLQINQEEQTVWLTSSMTGSNSWRNNDGGGSSNGNGTDAYREAERSQNSENEESSSNGSANTDQSSSDQSIRAEVVLKIPLIKYGVLANLNRLLLDTLKMCTSPGFLLKAIIFHRAVICLETVQKRVNENKEGREKLEYD